MLHVIVSPNFSQFIPVMVKFSHPCHRIRNVTEVSLASEALKFLSSRMSCRASWPPCWQPDNSGQVNNKNSGEKRVLII